MKIRGIALDTFENQIAGGDESPVHPDVIQIKDQHVPVSINFSTDKLVGRTTRIWKEHGCIWFEADIPFDTAAIGYTLEEQRLEEDGHRTIKGGRLFEIGLTDDNANRNQPTWSVVDDEEDARGSA